MDKYIFRTFDEVAAWVNDNKLSRYNFRNGRPGGEDKNNYIFTYDEDVSPEINLSNLERRLQAHAGLHLWGVGWRAKNSNTGGVMCEVQYGKDEDSQLAKLQSMISGGIGRPMQPEYSLEEMEKKMEERLTMKFRLEQMEKDRKDFEHDKREFEKEKNGVIGALVNYFAPVAQIWMQKQGLAKVAGTDVPAEKIVPVGDEAPDNGPEEQTADELPEEESIKAYELLVRFRNVEPQYLQLLESVVTMAENGDKTYEMAKNFLLK